MRAVLDANVLVSYLLAPGSASPPAKVVRQALSQTFELIVSEPACEEVIRTIERKPYLKSRIPAKEVHELIAALMMIARDVVPLPSQLERIVRDENDDFLADPVLLSRTDFIVSGDKDVLEIDAIGSVHFVSPIEFLKLLDLDL